MNLCSIDECDRATSTRGYCKSHYLRLRRHGDPLGGRTSRGAWEEWLRGQVDAEGCWEWPFATNKDGYGVVNIGQKVTRAHRAIYERLTGEAIPPGMMLMHSCDNPPCCNPRHLSPGGAQDNVQDMVDKRRSCRGERAPTAKLTEREARAILASDLPATSLADRYNVGAGQIRRIRQGLRWRHLSPNISTSN